jgi:predicted dehydrogenase
MPEDPNGGMVVLSRDYLRVAVIGLGKMGLVHSCILSVLPNVKLVAVCDKSGMTRRFLGKLFKSSHMLDDAEKLSSLDLDAAYVTTPIPSHYSITKLLYSKGIVRNVFVEKTLASSYEQAKELCVLAHRFGGTNMVGYTRRFAVTFNKAKALLAEDMIGEVSSFMAYAYSSDFAESGKGRIGGSRGGVLEDLGCHAVDLALWFFGDLDVVTAKISPYVDGGSENSVHFGVKTHDLKGEFDVSWCVPDYRMPEVGFAITGSKGTLEANDDFVELKPSIGKPIRWYRHDLDDNVCFWLGGPEYFREDQHFTNSIMKSREAESNFESATGTDKIIAKVKSRAEENE